MTEKQINLIKPAGDTTTQPSFNISSWDYGCCGLVHFDRANSRLRINFGDGKVAILTISDSKSLHAARDLILARSAVSKISHEFLRKKVLAAGNILATSHLVPPFSKHHDHEQDRVFSSTEILDKERRHAHGMMQHLNDNSNSNSNSNTNNNNDFDSTNKPKPNTKSKSVEGYLTTKIDRQWIRSYFHFKFDSARNLPILSCRNSKASPNATFEIELHNACVFAGGSSSFRLQDGDGRDESNNYKKSVFAFGVQTNNSFFIFASDDAEEISRWVGCLSTVLIDDARNVMLASDSTLLSSHLFEVLKRDECVGLLSNAEIRVNINVCESFQTVDVDIVSEGTTSASATTPAPAPAKAPAKAPMPPPKPPPADDDSVSVKKSKRSSKNSRRTSQPRPPPMGKGSGEGSRSVSSSTIAEEAGEGESERSENITRLPPTPPRAPPRAVPQAAKFDPTEITMAPPRRGFLRLSASEKFFYVVDAAVKPPLLRSFQTEAESKDTSNQLEALVLNSETMVKYACDKRKPMRRSRK